MKFSCRLQKSARIAAPAVLALLLAIALLPGAALAAPPPADGEQPPSTEDTPLPGGGQQQTPLPGGGQQQTPLPGGGQQQTPLPGGGQQQTPLPNGGQQQTPLPGGGQQQTPPSTEDTPLPGGGHPSAPSAPSSDCIVAHAATPAQLCSVAGGLQYYFIGADGSSQIGPYIKPFSELNTLYTSTVSLYTGTNPLTSKSVQINYLPAESKIWVGTYYPDTQYDTNKPYTFTVNESNSVAYEAW